ncbi:hypothetical protein [Billgrantia desiderata]|uniref:hypothetical protein n=1 Tax=Billgrantia desiderata TaxID=52021 RepID=UPI00089E691C|nr:hypothetical protein [Halomonas desiderata]SEG30746.1 hypothetical protein SAMN04487953_12266 [Halomonas desiderata]
MASMMLPMRYAPVEHSSIENARANFERWLDCVPQRRCRQNAQLLTLLDDSGLLFHSITRGLLPTQRRRLQQLGLAGLSERERLLIVADNLCVICSAISALCEQSDVDECGEHLLDRVNAALIRTRNHIRQLLQQLSPEDH